MEINSVKQNETIHPIFDRSVALTRLEDDEEFLHELLESYLEDTQNKIEEMRVHLENGDLDTIYVIAHSLKGSSGTVAAFSMQETALQLENAGKRGDLKKASANLEAVDNEYKKLKEFLGNLEIK
jgi:HPt (histidine-containing phosphotransfer) domain-containing protein